MRARHAAGPCAWTCEKRLGLALKCRLKTGRVSPGAQPGRYTACTGLPRRAGGALRPGCLPLMIASWARVPRAGLNPLFRIPRCGSLHQTENPVVTHASAAALHLL